TTLQIGAWSASGPWSSIVDELHPPVTYNCGSTAKLPVSWDLGSQRFSTVHATFGAHVPWMCPASVASSGCGTCQVERGSRDLWGVVGRCWSQWLLLLSLCCQPRGRAVLGTPDRAVGVGASSQ